MDCESCGAELPAGAKACPACHHTVGLGQKTAEGTRHAAEKTGEVAGKIGHGIVSGAKAMGAGAKKGFKGSHDDEKKKEN